MLCRTIPGRCGLSVYLAFVVLSPAAWSQAPGQVAREIPIPHQQGGFNSQARPGHADASRSPYQVAERTARVDDTVPGVPNLSQPTEHPLMPALRWAHEGLRDIEAINDYSAVIVKRERIGGKVNDHEKMFAKIRHRPLSVYLYFLSPPNLRGQEVIYIEGQNDGKMWAHGTGMRRQMFGTVSIKPDGVIAMQGNRYPITEIGILNLVRRLIEVAEADTKYGECEVKFYKGAKVAGRVCTCIEVVHPVPRRNFRFHLARIFVDDELNLPIRYEAYSWPTTPGGPPELIEEYTYLDLKLNPGFTDADFDIRNPNYQF